MEVTDILSWIPPHIFEWFVAPLLMYLLLFGLRDRFNILHMPLADFVALLVVADIALGINNTRFRHILDNEFKNALQRMHLHIRAPDSPIAWWALATLGVVLCILLVVLIEEEIRIVAIHHVTVGPSREIHAHYKRPIAALRTIEYRRFIYRWAAGFSGTAIYVALQTAALSALPAGPFASWAPALASYDVYVLIPAIGLTVFVVLVALGVSLTLLRVFRYSKTPLSSTYSRQDQAPPSVEHNACPEPAKPNTGRAV
jgi:hypothetical protein